MIEQNDRPQRKRRPAKGLIWSTEARRYVSPTRFWSRAAVTDNDCWLWLGLATSWGYGRYGPNVTAHRLAYELSHGPIQSGLQIDHLCRNRGCVNPDHLEAVTSTENKRRGVSPTAINARKTHCIRGHAYTPGSFRPNGTRVCRICAAAKEAEHRATHRKRRSQYMKEWRRRHQHGVGGGR